MSSSSTDIDFYGYTPTRSICIIFVGLFAVAMIAHMAISLLHKPRLWWLWPSIIVPAEIEMIGWIGRLISNGSPTSKMAWLMQEFSLYIGPTHMLMYLSAILCLVVPEFGERYSRFSLLVLKRIFLGLTVVVVLLQLVGVGIVTASKDLSNITGLGPTLMLAGIIAFLVCLCVFAVIALEVFVRYLKDWPIASRQDFNGLSGSRRSKMSMRMKIMLVALGLGTEFLMIRTGFRTIELAQGFDGKIMRTEWTFSVYDGSMMAMTIYLFLFTHPVWMLPATPATPDTCLPTEQLNLPIYRSGSGSARGSDERQYRGEASSFDRSASSVKV